MLFDGGLQVLPRDKLTSPTFRIQRQVVDRTAGRVRSMTHAQQTGAVNRLHFFLAPISDTCVEQISNRILLVPDSGAD